MDLARAQRAAANRRAAEDRACDEAFAEAQARLAARPGWFAPYEVPLRKVRGAVWSVRFSQGAVVVMCDGWATVEVTGPECLTRAADVIRSRK